MAPARPSPGPRGAAGPGSAAPKRTHSDMIAFDTLHAAETLTDAGINATHAKKAASTWRIVPAIGAFAAVAKLVP